MILSKNDNGPGVIYLQQTLSALGYQVAITGNFDEVTELALMNFQGLRGLTVDGKYGTQTATAIQDSLGRNIVAATMLQQAMQSTTNAPVSTKATPVQNQSIQAGFDIGSYIGPVIIAAIIFGMIKVK